MNHLKINDLNKKSMKYKSSIVNIYDAKTNFNHHTSKFNARLKGLFFFNASGEKPGIIGDKNECPVLFKVRLVK